MSTDTTARPGESIPAGRFRRYRWTADDLDQLERLVAYGLPSRIIGELMQPPASRQAIRCAARRAGIGIRDRKAGRPSVAERERWERLRAEMLATR